MRKYSLLVFILLGLVFGGVGCIGSSPSDAGILRSKDGGKNFDFANSVEGGGSLANVNVNQLVLSPTNSKQILAATERGYYFSSNQGDTWANVVFSSGSGRAAAIDPKNEKNVFVTLDQKIYKSSDGGQNFRDVYADQTNTIADLVLDPQNPSKLYAASESGAIIQSSDAGESWQTSAILKAVPVRILVNRHNARDIFVGTTTRGIFHSTDAGTTFESVNLTPLSDSSDGVLHVNDMTQNPYHDTEILAATNAGVIRSTNDGKSWVLINTLVLPDSVPVRSVSYHPNVQNVFFFAAANKLYVTQDNGSTWSLTDLSTTREIKDIAIDQNDKNTILLGVSGKPRKTQPVDFIKFGS